MIKAIKDNIDFINKTNNLILQYNHIFRLEPTTIEDKLHIKSFLYYSFFYPNKNICFDVFNYGDDKNDITKIYYITIFMGTLYLKSKHKKNLNRIKKHFNEKYNNISCNMVYIKIIYELEYFQDEEESPKCPINYNYILQSTIDICKRFAPFIFINDFVWEWTNINAVKLVSSNNIILHKITGIKETFDYIYFEYGFYATNKDSILFNNYTFIFKDLLYNFILYIIL